MRTGLFLYLDLLIFLAGTLLYGFLTREVLRRRRVLQRNLPLRLLFACWCLWYAGALIDGVLAMLLGDPRHVLGLNTGLDLLRGFAWLLSFPLLAHTLALERLDLERPVAAWRRLLPALAYLPLVLFIAPAISFARRGEWLLVREVAQIYPLILLHASISLGLAVSFALGLLRAAHDPRLSRFLKSLIAALAVLFAVLASALLVETWEETTGALRLLRTLVLAGLLLPGGLFAYFVQRYNLLRLSLSHGTLRHFVGVLLLVLLVMAAGPTLAHEHPDVLRRFVAWGLLMALFIGVAYRPLIDRALERSRTLRRLLGHHVAPQELDHLMETLQQLDLEEGDALARTADELGLWLGTRTFFLDEDADAEIFWNAFRDPEIQLIHQLDPPNARLAARLAALDLHAVFALRVDRRLVGVLGLALSRTGGGYADGEIEAIRLVLRQLAGTLALRRLLHHRLAEERRLAEHERLGMLGLVAASLAHELKNPLSSIKVLAQSLREELAGADPEAEGVRDLDCIVEQIDGLDSTAREILGLARPRPGASTELGQLVHSALYVLQAEARKRGVEIRSTVEDPGTVAGTAASWQTVIFNLTLNAVEHTPPGGETIVRLAPADGERLLFETRNPGPAIGRDEAERLFAPFVSEGGTGLGLALVARRLTELGGEVEVDHADGQVIFRVLAPLSPGTSAEIDDSETTGAETTAGGTR